MISEVLRPKRGSECDGRGAATAGVRRQLFLPAFPDRRQDPDIVRYQRAGHAGIAAASRHEKALPAEVSWGAEKRDGGTRPIRGHYRTYPSHRCVSAMTQTPEAVSTTLPSSYSRSPKNGQSRRSRSALGRTARRSRCRYDRCGGNNRRVVAGGTLSRAAGANRSPVWRLAVADRCGQSASAAP